MTNTQATSILLLTNNYMPTQTPTSNKQKKPDHDYTCEECGKTATFQEEDIRISHKVLPNEDFEEIGEKYIHDSGRFFCDDHYSR